MKPGRCEFCRGRGWVRDDVNEIRGTMLRKPCEFCRGRGYIIPEGVVFVRDECRTGDILVS